MMICRHNWMDVFHYGGIYNKVIGDPSTDEVWGKLEMKNVGEEYVGLSVGYTVDDYVGGFCMIINAKTEDGFYRVNANAVSGWPLTLLKALSNHSALNLYDGTVYYLTEMNLNKFIKRWEVILGFLIP